MLRNVLPLALLAGLAGGCYTEAVGYDNGYGYATAGTDLAYVAPGVEVVTGYDYPVFFADGFYWRWWGGGWARSPHWDHGWAPAGRVPVAVRGIAHPGAFAHFRPARGVAIRHVGGHRG